MEGLQPLMNFALLMTALSIAAERLANILKLRHPSLRGPGTRLGRREEKERERQIANRVLAVSVALAVLLKADFFAILSHLDAPWSTLGWTRDAAIRSPAQLVSTLGGTVLTGVSLGFGSKFWHDVLDIVYGVRDHIRVKRERVSGEQ
jgi:hypothetical protein